LCRYASDIVERDADEDDIYSTLSDSGQLSDTDSEAGGCTS
jgi:hypothetical protein